MDLVQLQGLIKRDPNAYRDEFLIQQRHFLAQLQVFQLKPTSDHKDFINLIQFMSQVAHCYPKDMQDFPTQIANLLEQNGKMMDPELRKALVQSLIMLRNKNVLSPTSLLSLFFKLFRIPDKRLRETLYHHIVNDIKRLNEKKKDDRINRPLQNFMYTMLQDPNPIAVRMSLHVMIELFKKHIWNDAKTANVISQAVFSKDTKVLLAALHFFLSPRITEEEEEEDDKEHRANRREIIKKYGHGAVKKTAKRKKKLRKALKELAKHRKEQLDRRLDDRRTYNYQAVMLINDPQGYAERVYSMLVRSNEKFETKIMIMNFLSRLISAHQLLVLDFYSLMLKYLQPHQQYVTQLLAIVAQACHPLISPETIEPVIRGICNQFITDRRTNEAIAIGLNTVREICLRCPLAMNATLLKDLVEYKTSKDKGVAMAAKSLITLFRVINPGLLPKKWRAKENDPTQAPLPYGAEHVMDHLPGTELLDQAELDSDFSDSDDDGWISLDDNPAPGLTVESVEVDFSDDEDMESKNTGESEQVGESEEQMSGVESGMASGDVPADEMSGEEDEDEDNVVKSKETGESAGEFNSAAEDARSVASSSVLSRPEAIRILSDEDFERIRILKEKAEEKAAKSKSKSKKRSFEEISQEDVFDIDREVDPEDIEGYKKRRKRDREERIQALQQAREEREAEKKEKELRRTNAQLRKNKPFAMIRQSEKVKRKSRMSLMEKKSRMSAHALRIKKMDKPKKAKILKK